MSTYIARRLLEFVPVLLLASMAVFLIMHAVPGDPAQVIAGWDAPDETVERIRREKGLDKPLPVQYVRWLSGVIQGDLGNSLVNDFPVSTLIWYKLPATLELAVVSIALAVLLCVPLGVLPALRPRSMWSYIASGVTAVAMAVPAFFVGLALILLFAVELRWLPPSGHADLLGDPVNGIRHLALPSVTLAVSLGSRLSLFVKSALADVLGQDYLRTARMKGLRERTVILRHAVKNAMIPVVTQLGIYLGRFMGGVVVIEVVFEWPGIGRLLMGGIGNRDYPVVMGTLLSVVAVFVLINLLVDVSYALLDPRIRLD